MTQLLMDAYQPSEEEPYMNDRQISYFKEKLTLQKTELRNKARRLMGRIKQYQVQHADIIDRSNVYMDMERQLTEYDRYTRLADQVEEALKRIDQGRFGYCELTGSPIGIRRLKALPFTHLSIEALESLEVEGTGRFGRSGGLRMSA